MFKTNFCSCYYRHPLQELCVDTFIPNDTHLKGGQGFRSQKIPATNDTLSRYFERTSLVKETKVERDNTTASSMTIESAKHVESNLKRENCEKKNHFWERIPLNTGDADLDDNASIFSKRSHQIMNEKDCDHNSNSKLSKGNTGGKFTLVSQDESEAINSNETNQNTQEENSVQIVTGANFSGKSVYLKQIALIVYMAHIGR